MLPLLTEENPMERRFTRAVMREALARSGRRCICTALLAPGNVHYDHVTPWEISRDSSLANCKAVCRACHDQKTYATDIPLIAKLKRMGDAHMGARKIASRPFPFGRGSGFKMTMGRKIVARMTLGQQMRQMGLVR
jgi:hypothetical protein